MHSPDDGLLRHDHVELGELLSQLIAAFESNEVARSYATLDLFWARLAMHIRAEHLHLFPAVSQAVSRHAGDQQTDAPSPDEADGIIAELREDHDFFMRQLSDGIAVLREFLKNPNTTVDKLFHDLRKTIDAVQTRLAKHNDLEENTIYIWSKSLLTETEQAGLDALVTKELRNMPQRFSVKPNDPTEVIPER